MLRVMRRRMRRKKDSSITGSTSSVVTASHWTERYQTLEIPGKHTLWPHPLVLVTPSNVWGRDLDPLISVPHLYIS